MRLALGKSIGVPRLLRLIGVKDIHVDWEQQVSDFFLERLLFDWSRTPFHQYARQLRHIWVTLKELSLPRP